MGTFNWGHDFTVVAGADLSAQQYKNVNVSGTLAGSSENVFGVLQNKPQSGEHATVRKIGYTKCYMPVSLGVGAVVMQSNANSGQIALVTSGQGGFGEIVFAASSGGIGTVYLYGGPTRQKLI